MPVVYPTEEGAPLPDYGSYGGIVDPGLSRTATPTPEPGQILDFNAPRTDITATFSMRNDLYNYWINWVNTNAYYWFYMPVVSQHEPVDIYSTMRARFTTGIEYTKRGDNWLSVTVGMELVPGDTDDPLAAAPREYNFVIGGTPASPSGPDTVQAGTPATPSTPDRIIGNIYAYEVT